MRHRGSFVCGTSADLHQHVVLDAKITRPEYFFLSGRDVVVSYAGEIRGGLLSASVLVYTAAIFFICYYRY